MSNGQYRCGRRVKPSTGPKGEDGSQTPSNMIAAVVTMSGVLARVWRKGIRLVRMTWMMSVCVSSDSTNHPVWNSDARVGSQHPKTSMGGELAFCFQ